MPSSVETTNADHPPGTPRWRAGFERWNRKLHFYVGLFLLWFLWLFAATGLILNHPSWSFTEFWKNRKQTNYEREITPPGPEVKGDLAQARIIMEQIGVRGEILWTTTRTDPSQFEFQVRRPGYFFFIKADLARHRVTVQQNEVNLWGVTRVLHTFTGVQMDDPRNRRDWLLTSMWAYSMDAVAAGIIFMVLSSLYLWFQLPQKRLPGALALGLGTLLCGLFCLGLKWLY